MLRPVPRETVLVSWFPLMLPGLGWSGGGGEGREVVEDEDEDGHGRGNFEGRVTTVHPRRSYRPPPPSTTSPPLQARAGHHRGPLPSAQEPFGDCWAHSMRTGAVRPSTGTQSDAVVRPAPFG